MSDKIEWKDGVMEFPIPHLYHELNVPSPLGGGVYLTRPEHVKDYIGTSIWSHPIVKNAALKGVIFSRDPWFEAFNALYSLPDDPSSFEDFIKASKELNRLLLKKFFRFFEERTLPIRRAIVNKVTKCLL